MLLLQGMMNYSYAQQATVTSFSPASVCQGETLTITGTNFQAGSTVKLGTYDATVTGITTTTITVIVPDLAVSGAFTVTTPTAGQANSAGPAVLPSPRPALEDQSGQDFASCKGDAAYTLTVINRSTVNGAGNQYKIDWGDNTAPFTQTNWPTGATTSHNYTKQGYFTITLTITPPYGCTKTITYQFYNGANPLASFTTTTSTTGLCAPAPVEFQIGNWFKNSPGTRYEIDFGDGSGKVILQHPLNPSGTIHRISHTYQTSSCPATDFKATLNAINGCFTTTYTLNQIIIRKKPVANFEIQPTIPCINENVCFINRTIDGYSGNNCSPATNFNWDFGDGTTSTDKSPCHIYKNAGTYKVTLTASNLTCGDDIIVKQVTVNPISPEPVVTSPVTYCKGQTASPLTATGASNGTLLWYTSGIGGTGSTTAPTPSTATAGTTTYYVSQLLPNHCESKRVPLNVIVHPLPAPPAVTTPVQLCLNQPATALTATGTGLLWYTSQTGGTGSTTAPIPSTTTISTTTYYVSQTANGCEGARAAITVVVNALPVAPIVTTPVTWCQHQAASPLAATGNNLSWYTTATGGTGSPIAPTPSTATPGTTKYYVSQGTGCGESPRQEITVTITPAPAATITYQPAILCNIAGTPAQPNPPVVPVISGTQGGRFSITPAGLPIDPNTGSINPVAASAGVYTVRYTVTGTGGCSNVTATATVTVNAAPQATLMYPAICSTDPVASPTHTGTQGGTFSSTPGLTLDRVTGAIAPNTSTPGTYIVTYTVAPAPPCPGFTTTAKVTVTKPANASIAYQPAVLCNAPNTPANTNPPVSPVRTGDAGGTYTVLPAAGLPIDLATGTITPAGATAGTYTISYHIQGVTGCANFTTTTTVTIQATPEADIKYPALCTANGITAVTLTGTTGGTFSSTTGLTIDPGTGAITPATSTPGTYKVTYTVAPGGTCPGTSASTTVVVTQAPSATIAYQPAVFCNVPNTPANTNPPVSPVRTGNAGGTYTVTPATGLPIDRATGTITPAGATAGIYTISYTVAGTGGCADFTATTTITIAATPQATISYPASPYCGATNLPQPVLRTGAAGGTFTATAGLSIDATTGAILPSASTPGTYTVTYTIAATPPCPGYVTTTAVVITESPVVTFPIATQTICSGETAVFKPASSVTNTTYTWSLTGALPPNMSGITSGNLSGTNPSLTLSFTNTGASSQSLTIKVTPTNPATNPCQGAAYNLTLVVKPATPAPAAATFNFCMGTPATALNVTPAPGTTIKWYDRTLTPLPAPPVINTNSATQLTYFISQTNTFGCESPRSQITVTIHPTAKVISTVAKHPVACGIPSGAIILELRDLNDGPMTNTPVQVHYKKFQTAHTFSGTTDGTGKVTIPLTAGTYTGIYVETKGACTSAKVPDVFILKDPTPPAAPVAGYNPPLCTEKPLTMTALSPTGNQAGPLKYVWAGPAFGPLADTLDNTVVTFPSAKMTDAGTYVVYAMQNNCISLPANFEVKISQSPAKPVITTRTPLCTGEQLSLQAFSSIPGNATLHYLWKGPGEGFPVQAAAAQINRVKITDGGIYTVTVTAPQTGCDASTDTLIQVGGYPIVKFAQPELTLPTGYRMQLSPVITNATEPGILPMKNYTWTPSQDLTCIDALCATVTATIKNDICYTVKATNIYGCTGTDKICIKTLCQNTQVFIPNAFAPNGNVPENRMLMVRATGIGTVKSFRVFNRWGKVVFERTNFAPNSPEFGWDGRVNGKLADTGVYIYTVEVICENGIPYAYKGNVTLL